MSEERLKRKITIILATDVFGYSKHIEEDETLTIKTYNDREVILLNLIKEFRGRVFNTGGASVFAEFSSAVDAVECAFTFQNKIYQIDWLYLAASGHRRLKIILKDSTPSFHWIIP